MNALQVTYHIDTVEQDVVPHAESVLLEQTVETPADVAERDDFVREHMMGSIRDITPDPAGGFRVTFSLPLHIASTDPAQLLNVLFGNASLHEHVRLLDFDAPANLLGQYPGPRFGIGGLRERTGVPERPLTCSALKPVGLPIHDLAALCRTLAEGGIDVIKDDHYLADHSFCPFQERVQACQAAVDEAAGKTGRRALYVPSLSGTPEMIRRQAEQAQRLGVGAVMVAPMLTGLPFLHELTTRHLDVPVLAHPSFAGHGRILPEVLFGKLFRLFGADAVIFANFGGRFSYTRETCARMAGWMRRDWSGLPPALPVPAGGMSLARVPELVQFFGPDTMLLIGGSLLRAGHDLLAQTEAFVASVVRAALTHNGTA